MQNTIIFWPIPWFIAWIKSMFFFYTSWASEDYEVKLQVKEAWCRVKSNKPLKGWYVYTFPGRRYSGFFWAFDFSSLTSQFQTWVQIYFSSEDVVKFWGTFTPPKVFAGTFAQKCRRETFKIWRLWLWGQNDGGNNDSNTERSTLPAQSVLVR